MKRAFRLFSSVRFGIFLIAAILVYGTLGSAIPGFRQVFELTEFQYFNHWIFAALIGCFCLTLTVTTFRRIRVNVLNAGVLTVHSGLLILCAGSMLYFGLKIEGDVLLEAPRIEVLSRARLAAGSPRAVVGTFVAVEGKTWQTDMPVLGGRYRMAVTGVWHRGLEAASRVRLDVGIGDAAPRFVELSASTPASRVVALNDDIALRLVGATVTDTFFDDVTPLLRLMHDGGSVDVAMPSLPYYRERFTPSGADILDIQGKVVASSRSRPLAFLEHWKMPFSIDVASRADASDWPIEIEVDGYLPYAQLERMPTAGGVETNPAVQIQVSDGEHAHREWLFAESPAGSMIETSGGASVGYRWIGDRTRIDERWVTPLAGRHVLEVFVKDAGVRRQYDVVEGQSIRVGGTDYTLSVERLHPRWPLMTAGFEGARTPAALVWVESPDQAFQRSVLQRFGELNQDRDRAGEKLNPGGGLVDENIGIRYTDASGDHFMIFAGEAFAPTVVHTAPGGGRTVHPLEAGRAIEVESGVSMTLLQQIVRPTWREVPRVIPMRRRQPFSNVRRGRSMVRVHMTSTAGDWSRRVWVPFSHYNAEGLDGTIPTRVRDVPGVGDLLLVYGRVPRRLPGRITLERLETSFYPGRQRPSGWTSFIRYEDPTTRTVYRDKAYLNHTARLGPWSLYQATAAGDHESWTGLGVGNRDGVLSMLLGCTLISVGMIYAFAVKPVLLRRRRRAARRAVRPGPSGGDDAGDGRAVVERRTVQEAVARLALVAVLVLGLMGTRVLAEDARPPAGLAAGGGPAVDLLDLQQRDLLHLDKLGAMVVQHNARYSTVEAWARELTETVCGPESLAGLDPLVAAVELMFNGRAYDAEPIIHVKDRALRKDITAYPVEMGDSKRRDIISTGMVSLDFLTSPGVSGILRRLETDALRKKPMDRLFASMGYYTRLEGTFAIVPSRGDSPDEPWSTVDALFANAGLPSHMVGGRMAAPVPGVGEAEARDIIRAYLQWRESWLARDADGINEAIGRLDAVLPTLAASGVYPSASRRRAEVAYHRLGLMRWSWVSYIGAFFISIFAVATRYRWVRAAGLTLLVVGVLLHGGALGLRWFVIGRIPVANMYEAVVSSAWIGAMFGLLLELIARKRVYLLASSLLGFFALALPELNVIHSGITTMMPILDDVMLRIHTVLIIGSYAVITLAFAVANCYLFVAAFRDRAPVAQGTIGAELGAIACLVFAKVGMLAGFTAAGVVACFGVCIVGGLLLTLGVCAALPRRVGSPGTGPDAVSPSVRRGLLKELDLSHRVLLTTASVALFVGLVLGAVWADYSWGRPWGWDPKEVFALNTWLVYAILIHVGFVARRRALWTSVVSVFGFATMQFNWWVVNFYIVGLHSYA